MRKQIVISWDNTKAGLDDASTAELTVFDVIGRGANVGSVEDAPVFVPTLDHDVLMAETYGQGISPTGKVERALVAALIEHLWDRGWEPQYVDDGEEIVDVSAGMMEVAKKNAMELLFNLDDAYLHFARGDNTHGVRLVFGNDGWDSINDWNYSDGDPDGFNAAMDAFDVEQFE